MPDPTIAFAADLLRRGIEIVCKNNHLRYWSPSQKWNAYNNLTDTERAFIREHREQLKTLARAGLTTLADTSNETKALAIENLVTMSATTPATTTYLPPPATTAIGCVYCGSRPCVGNEHPAFSILHFRDPAEEQRRTERATAELMVSLRYRVTSPYI